MMDNFGKIVMSVQMAEEMGARDGDILLIEIDPSYDPEAFPMIFAKHLTEPVDTGEIKEEVKSDYEKTEEKQRYHREMRGMMRIVEDE